MSIQARCTHCHVRQLVPLDAPPAPGGLLVRCMACNRPFHLGTDAPAPGQADSPREAYAAEDTPFPGNGAESDSLLDRLSNEIFRGDLGFPTLPATVQAVGKILDGEPGREGLLALAGADPVFAARLVSTANSIRYRGLSPVTNLPAALDRIGIHAAADLLRGMVKEGGVSEDLPCAPGILPALWQQAAAEARVARVLSEHLRFGNPDTAFLAALLMQIGAVYLADGMIRLGAIDSSIHALPANLFEEILRTHTATLGARILRQWHVPDEIVQAVAAQPDPAPDGDTPRLAWILAASHRITVRLGLARPGLQPEPFLSNTQTMKELHLEDIDLAVLLVKLEDMNLAGEGAPVS